MSDLSTANLKRLLDEATPGPWVFREDTSDTPSGMQEIGHEVYAEEKYLFSVWDDPVTDEHPGNLPLAALAPDLAQEVLRMRTELNAMKRAWLYMTIEPHLSGLERTLAAQALNSIDEVLGDHDG